ncbi:MAG: caspase family protein [Myxococcales bacterium]
MATAFSRAAAVRAAAVRALVAAATLATFLPATGAQAQADTGRFALVVGSNLGDRAEPVLHHAEDDASKLAQTFRLLGEFPADQVVLMTGATAAEMHDALIRLNARVREHSNGVLVVFYSGHADATALHLAGTRLGMAELKTLLVGSPAASRLLIVDACRSGSLIQLKGAHPAPPFEVPVFTEPVPEGFAVLTSSAASEDSQESAALGSSYFTYYVNSGLMGAADQDRDGAVTLSELYAFASAETRAATTDSVAGPQNPTFQFALGGRHDLVLTRLGRRDVRLGTLRFAQAGRYVVQRRDVAGLSPPVAEVAARDPGAELALAPGRYRVTLRGDRDISERELTVTGGEVTAVELGQLIRVDVGRTVRKGGPRRSATGFAVALGWHSLELPGSSLALGSGPALLVSARHDRRWLSVEARLGFDRGTLTDVAGVELDNRALTPSALAVAPFDWGPLTLAIGVEAGVVLMHQSMALSADHAQLLSAPATTSLLTPRWSTGLQAGPVTQVDSPLGPHSYLRFEAGLIWRSFDDGAHRGAHLRLLAGAGAAF